MNIENGIFLCPWKVLPMSVDYNGHMNDAEYGKLFSRSLDHWIDALGLDERGKENFQYTFFTLEAHICYLKEVEEGERLTVFPQVIDRDEKRIHLFMIMENSKEEPVATSEQMVMGMDKTTNRPAPFPENMHENLQKYHRAQKDLVTPKEVGRKIGIRRK
ncbi:thioesterase [Isachenkonia alkalipeptolytica]|uniref:Thioesterase n=2 Tax=Isachenkonia alkalipeptolytica TaxID=2565777 RepID=A0AA43XKA6_9CLOT|nr:thioesterase [Isachenkonia alkalipeptolytica]